MGYKDKAREREASKERVRRYRVLKKGVTGKAKGVTLEQGVTLQVVTPSVTVSEGMTPPVMHMLADVKRRGKLQAIYTELKRRELAGHVWVGMGRRPVRMDRVGEWLGALGGD